MQAEAVWYINDSSTCFISGFTDYCDSKAATERILRETSLPQLSSYSVMDHTLPLLRRRI